MTVDAQAPGASNAHGPTRAADLDPRSAVITGRGWHVPDDVLSNEDVAGRLDGRLLTEWVATNKWCLKQLRGAAPPTVRAEMEALFVTYVGERIGIKERRVIDREAIVRGVPSDSGRFASDLGARAAEQAVMGAGLAASDVEMIICGTSSPDGIYPPTAVEIQRQLGATNAYAFDLLAACSSFAFGLQIARGMIGAGIHRRVLVVSAEYFTAGVNFTDPESAFFFGDGAAAALVEPAGECIGRSGFELVDTRALSIPSRSIRTGLGGTRSFLAGAARNHGHTDAEIEFGAPDDPYFYQDGRRVFRDVVPTVATETHAFLEQNGLVAGEIDRFWFHQPSSLFLGAIAKRLLDVQDDDPRVVVGFDRYGNTSSSGAAMCMARENQLQPGQFGCMSVFGAGYSIGLALVRALGV